MTPTRILDTARRPTPPRPLPGALVACLAGLLASPVATAAGFGEIILHSRIGESLLAEVPLLGADKEIADPACYTLAPHPGSDLPVVTSARLRIAHNNNGYRLLIVGNKAIADPVFTISLRANCGLDLQHDYVLMPDAPMQFAELVEKAAPSQGTRRTDSEAAVDRPARAAPPATRPTRQRRADAAPDAPGKSRARQETTAGPAAPVAARPSPDKEPAGDRLLLSSAPLTLKPGDIPSASGIEMEERVLKMETSLRALSQEMDSLNTSLTLSTEMLTAKHELQLAQNLQPPGMSSARAAPPAAPSRDSSAGNWLELALGTLLGGSLAAGLAALLGRRRKTSGKKI